MIPRQMNFYWTGGPLSWLRRQTIETFRRLNPEYRILLHTDADSEVEGVETRRITKGTTARSFSELRAKLAPDTACDLYRWEWLAEHGGWFSDTDIVYLESLPEPPNDVLLTYDGGTPSADRSAAFAIGLVAAPPGHQFIRWIADIAQRSLHSADHQCAGSACLAANWHRRRCTPRLLPAARLYPFGFYQVQLARAWSSDAALPDDLLGLHWSGGHPRSKTWEPVINAGNYSKWHHPVGKALQRAS